MIMTKVMFSNIFYISSYSVSLNKKDMKKLTFILVLFAAISTNAQFKMPTYTNVVEGAETFTPELAFAIGGLGTTVFINDRTMHNDANLNLTVAEQNKKTFTTFASGVIISFGGYHLIKYIREQKPFKKKKYKHRHRY